MPKLSNNIQYSPKVGSDKLPDIPHGDLEDIGTNTHDAIDTHVADSTLHFTEASIDHTAIANIGTNAHSAIDTHIADTTLHFEESDINSLYNGVAVAGTTHTRGLIVRTTTASNPYIDFQTSGSVSQGLMGIDSSDRFLFYNGVAGGTLQIQARNGADSANNNMILGDPDGEVELFYAGSTAMKTISGSIKFGTHTGIGAETVTGYITVEDAGGTSRKLAVVS